jgi:hypothetical protein
LDILGVTDDVVLDAATLRAAFNWKPSARTKRALAARAEAISKAREALSALADQELRGEVAAVLDQQMLDTGTTAVPISFADAIKMSRDEMLDFLAEGAGFDVELEVIYPGAVDPTA